MTSIQYLPVDAVAACPLCGYGEKLTIELSNDGWRVFCHSCKGWGPSAESEGLALDAWHESVLFTDCHIDDFGSGDIVHAVTGTQQARRSNEIQEYNREAVMISTTTLMLSIFYRRLRASIRPLIRLLCWIARLDLDFVPLGKAGDMLPSLFYCPRCKRVFYSSVSLCNEEIVTCPHCGTSYLSANNCSVAWIMHEVDTSKLKRSK